MKVIIRATACSQQLNPTNTSEESFKAEEVMQLMDSGYIRERFGITDTSLFAQSGKHGQYSLWHGRKR
jgi:hypothetical protein